MSLDKDLRWLRDQANLIQGPMLYSAEAEGVSTQKGWNATVGLPGGKMYSASDPESPAKAVKKLRAKVEEALKKDEP